MELKEIIPLYRRWLWLLLVALIVGMGLGFLASRLQKPVYEASAKVLVAKNRPPGTADILSLSDQQLVATYQQIVKTQPVLDQAGTKLGMSISPDSVRTEVLPNTQIIRITAADSDPRRAASIANTLVGVLIAQNEALLDGRYGAYEQGLDAQVAQVQKQITDMQAQVSKINEAGVQAQLAQVNQQIASLESDIRDLQKSMAEMPIYTLADRAILAEKQAQLNQSRSLLSLYQQIQTNLTYVGKPVNVGGLPSDPQVVSLQSTLNLYQELYLNLLNSLETVKLARLQGTPMISQLDRAVPPTTPIRPLPLLYVVLGGIIGLLLSAAGVLLLDYFDDSLQTRQKVQELLRAPVIGQISDVSSAKAAWYRRTLHPEQAMARRADEFGSLRMNLYRLLARNSQKAVLITSAWPGEGKTTISANLAKSFALAGKRVILVDADLAHPGIHKEFGLEKHLGVSDILSGEVDWQEASWTQDHVTVITAGSNKAASGVLESDKMTDLLDQLQRQADIVIVDGPPLFMLGAQILASKVGSMVFVVQQGVTKTSVARSVRDQLELMDIRLLGVVINRMPPTTSHYFGDYYITGTMSNNGKEKHEEAKAI